MTNKEKLLQLLKKNYDLSKKQLRLLYEALFYFEKNFSKYINLDEFQQTVDSTIDEILYTIEKITLLRKQVEDLDDITDECFNEFEKEVEENIQEWLEIESQILKFLKKK